MTIDCPSDCVFLIASRRHGEDRVREDTKELPFADKGISYSAIATHEALLTQFAYAICELAAGNRAVVDPDVLAASQALAETYVTLANGIVYERPPSAPIEREIYERLRAEVEKYARRDSGGLGVSPAVGDSVLRDVLIAFTRMAAARSNGRRKGRAFLDYLRSHFKPGTFAHEESRIILA